MKAEIVNNFFTRYNFEQLPSYINFVFVDERHAGDRKGGQKIFIGLQMSLFK